MQLEFPLMTTILVCLASSEKDARPHIIFILADDLGWNDVSYNGMTEIKTPNIDALASAGVVLNNYYTLPVCTPSRAALLTGLYAVRTGLQHLSVSQAAPAALSLNFTLLPQWLKSLGYATHVIGKWDMGFFWRNHTPTYRGFDTHYGYWGGTIDYFQHTIIDYDKGSKYVNSPPELNNLTIARAGIDFRENLKPMTDNIGEYVTDILTNRATALIKRHDVSKPMFLYLSHLAVRKGARNLPDRAPWKYVRRFQYIDEPHRRIFAAKLTALDQSIGLIMEVLLEKGMLSNSLVIFSSDNGADVNGFFPSGGSNWPLRGEKATNWEGGIRVPALVWGPSLQKTPRVSSGLMHISDWLPTLYKAAGGKVSDLGRIDGIDLWPAIEDDQPSARSGFLINIDPILGTSAIRQGSLKLVNGSMKRMDSWFGPSGKLDEPQDDPESCKVRDVLEKFYGTKMPAFGRNIIPSVDCGGPPPSSPTICGIEGCLFNLTEDPCEYRDISQMYPEKVAELWEKIRRTETVPPILLQKDYNAGPMMHCGFWDTWLDEFSVPMDCHKTDVYTM